MHLKEEFIVGFRGISVNKLRSALTMLGIIIGVAAVISMVSITEGARKRVSQSIEDLGSNLIMVLPEKYSGGTKKLGGGRSRGLTYGDSLAIAKIPYVDNVAPIITIPVKLKYIKKDYNVTIEGTLPSYQAVRNFYVKTGRFISLRDIEGCLQTVVIGKTIGEDLFPDNDPVGKEIKIGDNRFVVIGVMEEKGQVAFVNFNEKVFIPITTAIKRFSGTDLVSNLQIQVIDRDVTKKAMIKVQEVLLNRHQRVFDFRLVSQEEFLKTIEQTTLTFKLMLGGIAAISLLVGGIGIMNIMLVSVTERTREIGIRKALGATRGDILGQFLVESVTISFIGGALGILLGILLGMAMSDIMARSFPAGGEWPLVISPASIATGFLFSVTVGIFFGIYPAHKASGLDPVDALRYE